LRHLKPTLFPSRLYFFPRETKVLVIIRVSFCVTFDKESITAFYCLYSHTYALSTTPQLPADGAVINV
jgi:hypothetical protein